MTLHQRRTHPVPVEGCWACRVATIQVSPAAMTARLEGDRDYAYQQRFAGEWERGDRDAYRRLRREGYQPPHIAGSAVLEKHASTPYEIETGRVSENPRQLSEALTILNDNGFETKAQTKPLSGGLL